MPARAASSGGPPIVVDKFGGSVLRRPDDIAAAVEVVAGQQASGLRPVVVVSAFEGVTDAILASASVLLLERTYGPRLSALEPPASVVIGPEGGFTPDEVAAAERANLVLAGLGPRILRSETVAVAAAAVILSRTGDFA